MIKLNKNISIFIPVRTMMSGKNFFRINGSASCVLSKISTSFSSVSLSIQNKPLILNYLRFHVIDKNHLSNKFFNKTDNLISSLQKPLLLTTDSNKPLLLTIDPNKNFNSGLMTLNLQEYKYFKKNDVENTLEEAQLYIKTVKTLLIKVFIALHGITENISLNDKFDLIFNAFGLDLNALPKYLSNKKCITMLQHILVYVCHDKKFSYEMLEDFAYPINCESYKNQKITILPFIEAYIIKKNLLNNTTSKPFTTYYLVNPDNLQAIPGFIPIESMQQAGQRNSDLLRITTNFISVQKYYADVKTFITAGFFQRNLLSIWFFNKKDFLKELNNVKITLQALINNEKDVLLKERMEVLLKNIMNIKNFKNLNQEVQAIKLHELLLEFKMDPRNETILIALNMPIITSLTSEFENNFLNLLNRIINRLDQEGSNDNLVIIFPSTTQIDEQQRLQFLNDFVNNHFQDELELKQQILNNINSQLCIENS